MLKDDLFDASRSIFVMVDVLSGFAHFNYLIFMHSPENKLLTWYVFDQVLSFDYVEHLPDLVFTESVNEVNLIEIYELCVLGGDGKRASDLALM